MTRRRDPLASLITAIWLALVCCAGGEALAGDSDCASLKWSVAREISLLSSADLPALASGAAVPGAAAFAVSLRLEPVAHVRYALAPERAIKPDSPFGGMLVIETLAAGRYHVTLSEEAWIDLVQNGAFVASTDHTSAKTCAPIRKSVEFLTAGGPATVQLSSAKASSIAIAVVKLD